MLRAANSPIKHIVVVTMENRSFDHFLGWLPNANGKQAGLSYDSTGVSHPTNELGPDWTCCGYNDPDHSYGGGRIEIDNGLMDGFFEHVPPPRALAPNDTDPDVVDGKALLGCRVPWIVASSWTVGTASNPTVDHAVFRETSNDVGNLLSAIDLNNTAKTAPVLPQPQSVIPQKICPSSINPGGGLTLEEARPDDESGAFRRIEKAEKERGRRVYHSVEGSGAAKPRPPPITYVFLVPFSVPAASGPLYLPSNLLPSIVSSVV